METEDIDWAVLQGLTDWLHGVGTTRKDGHSCRKRKKYCGCCCCQVHEMATAIPKQKKELVMVGR